MNSRGETLETCLDFVQEFGLGGTSKSLAGQNTMGSASLLLLPIDIYILPYLKLVLDRRLLSSSLSESENGLFLNQCSNEKVI